MHTASFASALALGLLSFGSGSLFNEAALLLLELRRLLRREHRRHLLLLIGLQGSALSLLALLLRLLVAWWVEVKKRLLIWASTGSGRGDRLDSQASEVSLWILCVLRAHVADWVLPRAVVSGEH